MRKLAIVFALVLGLGLAAKADDVAPASKPEVHLAHNGYNLIEVQIPDAQLAGAEVKLYNIHFSLLHRELISSDAVKRFDISTLSPGLYIIKVERNGQVLYTQVVKKVR